ncbi:MAG: tetratricopeptide repeat protein, partial [Verrucomicrobiota bacterium]
MKSIIWACVGFMLLNALFAQEDGPLGKALKRYENTEITNAEEERQAYDTAIADIDKVIEDDPKNVAAHYHRGRFLFYLESDEDAEKAYTKALSLDPDHVDANFMLAVLFMYGNRLEEAESLFEKVIELKPAGVEARVELIRLLNRTDRSDQTQEHVEAILEVQPRSPFANHEMGGILSSQDKQKEALPFFQTATEADPENSLYLWNFAQSLQLLDLDKEAMEQFSAYHKLAPEDWRAHQKLIQTAEELGNTEARDTWHESIYALWKSGKAQDLNERAFFVRDQFAEGDYYVYGLEYFELVGERAIKYSLQVKNTKDSNEEFRISLGSYETTHQIAKEAGSLPDGVRLFHLDGYVGAAHYTYGMFHGNPGYDET